MMPRVRVAVEEIVTVTMKVQVVDRVMNLDGVQLLRWKNWDLMLVVLRDGKLFSDEVHISW